MVALLAGGASAADASIGVSWLVRAAQSLAVAYLLFSAIRRFVANPLMLSVATWIGVPAAILWAFGYLDDTLAWLDSLAISVGNIRISVLFLIKAVAADPRVLSEPEPPQTELRRFGEFRVAFAVTFWVDGLDDGPNRFSSDIQFRIWEALRDAAIPMTAKAAGSAIRPPGERDDRDSEGARPAG
jgi:hypothetical protein